MPLSDRLTVVIRSAEERTAETCTEILAEQLGAFPLIVQERPFSRALACSLTLAARRTTPWSLMLDADVLLRSQALQRMVEIMEAETAPFYMCNFLVLDFGFGGPTYAGVHGYTTALIPQALEFLSSVSEHHRPESQLRTRMRSAGHPSVKSTCVTGLHDYEQFFRDLYRKSFVRAFKFDRLAPYMFERLYRRQEDSDEYRVMMAGLTDGMAVAGEGERVTLDSHAYRERSDRALTFLRLNERLPLEVDAWKNQADRLIGSFEPDALYMAHRPQLARVGYEL